MFKTRIKGNFLDKDFSVRVSYSMSYSLNALLQTRVVGGWGVGSHVDPLVGKFGANQGEEDTSTLLLCSMYPRIIPLKQQLHTSDQEHQSATDRGTTCATRQPRGCTGWL